MVQQRKVNIVFIVTLINEHNKEPALVDSFLNTIMALIQFVFGIIIHSMLSVKQAKKLTDCDIQKTDQRRNS